MNEKLLESALYVVKTLATRAESLNPTLQHDMLCVIERVCRAATENDGLPRLSYDEVSHIIETAMNDNDEN